MTHTLINLKPFKNTIHVAYFIVISLLIISCTGKKKDTEKVQEKSVSTSTPTADEDTSIFSLSGGGNEPGWNIKATPTGNGVYYTITLDYGEISLSGYGSYTENNDELKIMLGKTEIPISIKTKPCTDDAGNTNAVSLDFSFYNKDYTGCGNTSLKSLDLNPPKIGKSVDHYLCFNANNDNANGLMLGFAKGGFAKTVKYEGQNESIPLEFIAEEFQKGGAYPTVIKYYKEIYDNQLNGWYKITHAGNWDYVEYQNVKHKAVFNFTIDHNKTPYSKKPCL